jgi:hypothetical protein
MIHSVYRLSEIILNTRPVVWVVKEQVKRDMTGSTPMDYTPAYEYGDLKFITDMDPPIHGSSTVKPEWLKQVGGFIREFNPDRDFMILTGSPLAIFVLGMMVGKINSRYPIQILVWRREQNKYVLTTY